MSFGWLVGLALLVAGCKSNDNVRVTRTQPLLGTFVSITIQGSTKAAAISAAFDEVRRVDDLLSIHKTNSEAAIVNREAGDRAAFVSEEFFGVVKRGQRFAEVTEGAFDLSIRPLADLYGFIWKEYRLPSEGELLRVMPLVNYRNVRLGERTVKFAKGMSLDFGGIGKGYAVDRAVQVLKEKGVESGMVRCGGDLAVFGNKSWFVQIEDPSKKGKRRGIWLKEEAISTSGNYENFFIVGGKRYSHILNPKTGFPVEGIVSCSVIAKTCTESDALATGFFVMGPDKAIRQFGSQYDIHFLLMDQNKKIREVTTPGFGMK